MAEKESQTTQKADTAPEADKKTAEAPAVTKEDILEAASLAAKEAAEAATKAAAANTKEVVDKHAATEADYKERLEAIAAAATGKAKDPDVDPLLEDLLRNPSGLLAENNELIVEKVFEKLSAKETEKKEMDAAILSAFAERPDLVDEASKDSISARFYQTNPKDSYEDRLKEAIKLHDKFVENLGLGDIESRVKAASSVPATNASAHSGSIQESAFDEKAELQKEMDAAAAKHNRAMNITD